MEDLPRLRRIEITFNSKNNAMAVKKPINKISNLLSSSVLAIVGKNMQHQNNFEASKDVLFKNQCCYANTTYKSICETDRDLSLI